MLLERPGAKNNKKYVLIEDNECLKDLNNYLPNFLIYLWENPQIMATILSNSNKKDFKDNLASFVVNNFYENILSSNYIEDNLMYLLTLMLKEEINNLKNIDEIDCFLNESSPVGHLLFELRRKNDIQNFFKNVIFNAVDYLENVSSKEFNLNIEEIVDITYVNINNKSIDYEENEDEKIEIIKRGKTYTDDFYKSQFDEAANYLNLNLEQLTLKQITDKEKKKFDKFTEKYLGTLNLKEIKNLSENKFINNKEMKDYCDEQIKNCQKYENDENLYSNGKLMYKLFQTIDAQKYLFIYQKDFVKIIEFIDQLLSDLKNNLYLISYSVKCLCKIISILLEKKFPTITTTQKIAFISRFFFNKLLISILLNPANEVLINNFIITKSTLFNIKIINKVLLQLVSGKFFNDKDNIYYTPFNWYFIDKMPDIIGIFEKITKVTLPSFIDKLLNDKLDENFKYDYFEENPEEIIFHRSICFNLNNIKSILKSIENCKGKIFNSLSQNFTKTFEKLNSDKNKKFLENLLNEEDFEMTKKEIKCRKSQGEIRNSKNDKFDFENVVQKENYFIITSLVVKDKYKDSFNLNSDNKPNYEIKTIKDPTSDEDKMKNNIIKVKNYFCSLLYNYRKLILTDFDEGKTSNTVDILKFLKNFIKSSNNIADNSIPSEWYIDSLLEYLKMIPNELTNNDFEKLYIEIENELNSAIKKLDFEALSICLDKLKFAKRGKDYYEEVKKSTKQLEINENVKEIIEEYYIPVEINFKYNDDQKIFNITKSKIKEKKFLKKQEKIKRKNNFFCDNIKSFTEKFPNLLVFQEMQDKDLFEMQKELSIPEKIDEYFQSIKENIISNKKVSSSSELNDIYDKIYDYIMSKIYNKIFPKTHDNDDKIFTKTIKLSWIEPKHFITKKANFILDSFLPRVIDNFKFLEKEKSPRKKISYMKDIFNLIIKLVKFNDGNEDPGVDDILPILNYCFIKAQPNRIYSNTKFIELYIGDLSSKQEGSQIIQLLALCDFVMNLNYTSIYGVSQEEFNKKCNYAATGRRVSS